jgi:tetratricopeptide (TPR) repeat protein
MLGAKLLLLVAAGAIPASSATLERGGSALAEALAYAEDALARGKPAEALAHVGRALERDAKSLEAWDLRARCEEALGDRDLQAHALHQELRLAIAQKRPKSEVDAVQLRVLAADPTARDLFDLTRNFVPRLRAVAEQYVKDGRPHSAIRAYKEILALAPDSPEIQAAIQAVASAPDPSLAGDAKPKDLLADVSAEWIRERDLKHATWEDRDKLTREHYVTLTDSGYANLVRAAEAMEQMNAFYREFFQYGVEGDGHSVPTIELRLFKNRDEYLKKGSSPVEWSGGQFTGDAVETFVSDSGFDGMVGTLFHEAAHQFVGLATSASGWLNEGLASFFEGTRILSNGTVIMNLPANHRLFPMVARLEKGWMQDEGDGIDPAAPSKSDPKKAPTFRIVLENKYEWGPAWYAPTWAVVYFLYNYQDPVDGRFVYRGAFREFVNSSGGRVGEGAVKNFEEVVLANPAPPIKGVARPKDAPEVALPKTVEELDPVWRDWLVSLKKEQNGEIDVARPYLDWARAAIKAKDDGAAREHFEKALIAAPGDVTTLLEFAAFLADRKGSDRASKLALEALRLLESREPVDEAAVTAAEKSLDKWDPKRKTLAGIHEDLWTAAKNVVHGYSAAGMPTMVLDLSWRLGSDLSVPGMSELYEAALRQGARPVQIWELAYDEESLEGWGVQPDSGFKADGRTLVATFGKYDEKVFDYRILTLDAVTSGDWSLQADVLARKGEVNFCGLVFGRKDAQNFHGLILFPGRTEASGSREGLATTGFIDLASCFGGTSFKTWRHNPVDTASEGPAKDRTGVAEVWHTLRVDVADGTIDTWFDGEFLSTQEFPSADPLRGSLGLIVGPGEARFRDVRFLARPPRDPSARIERAVRMAELESQGGPPPGGSFLGRVPPFPKIGKWVQGSRKDWGEVRFAPQLLVLWSIQQNDIVPIDTWLLDLAARQKRVGLEIVSIASANDADALAGYLETHPMPGAVAVDARAKPGLGESFDLFSISRFNLPRLILIGIDGKVVWEGDPGFSRGTAEATDSFLDGPLAELIGKNKLEVLADWIARWNSTGAPAIAAGDLRTALPLMQEARTLPEGRVSLVEDAKKKLGAIEAAVGGLAATAGALSEAGTDPALQPLLEYGQVLKRSADKSTQLVLARLKESKASRDWEEVLKRCGPIAKSVKDERKLALAAELVQKLPTMAGRFPSELLQDLGPAVERADVARVVELATAAPERPRRWLVGEYLRW